MNKKIIHIISGGTMVHISPHFSLCARAYGKIGEQIYRALQERARRGQLGHYEIECHKTNMAGGNDRLETNADIKKLVKKLVADESTRSIIMPAAVCDWIPKRLVQKDIIVTDFGNHTQRLKTSDDEINIKLIPDEKIIRSIREHRKDIFLVTFKTTTGMDKEHVYKAGLHALKASRSNIVVANDIHTKQNVIITPEEFPYYFGNDRNLMVNRLADMIAKRTSLTFSSSDVVPDTIKDLNILSDANAIPKNFIPVLQFLIDCGAYKKFRGSTTGHFGCKTVGTTFSAISSVRKANHNNVFEDGVVAIYGKRDGKIIVGGVKASVGEHTQQAIYGKFGDKVHSVVHFHCDKKEDVTHIPITEQFNFECGSDQCAANTVHNMKEIEPGIFAVHINGHGPNIAFHRDADVENVKKFIYKHWNLSKKSGGNIPQD